MLNQDEDIKAMNANQNTQSVKISERARELHFSSLVVDSHCDSISREVDDGHDLGTETGEGHLDLPRIRAGNLGVQWWSCFVSARHVPENRTMDRTITLLDALKRMCERHPDDFEIALTAADCRRIVSEGKHAAVPCIEGGHAINDSLSALRLYHELGIRYITLTHFNTNNWADASTDAPRNDGLSLFGRDVVQEMDRLGMVVDISHTSDKTFWDTIEVTNNPIMASHSSAWELSKHPRNLKDDMLRAVATNGGVVNVNFDPKYISESLRVAYDKNEEQRWEEIDELEKLASRAPVAHWSGTPEYVEEQRKEILRRYSEERKAMQLPNVSDVVDHIDHIARIAGIDHVGLGSDFDGIPPPPIGIEDVSKFPNITEELVKREYSDEDIRKVLGENTMRVMEACVGE